MQVAGENVKTKIAVTVTNESKTSNGARGDHQLLQGRISAAMIEEVSLAAKDCKCPTWRFLQPDEVCPRRKV